jgi:hypothetical protein
MAKSDTRAQVFAIVMGCCGLAGCGLVVPDIKEAWDADRPANPATGEPKISATAQIEFEIKKRVYCELKEAVQAVNQIEVSSGSYGRLSPPKRGILPLAWGAQVSLSLQVDESAALNPGVAFNQVMPNAISVFGPSNTVTTSQSFNLGFGAALSSTATRIDKFDPYWSIAYLMIPEKPYSVCRDGNDPFQEIGWKPASSSPFILHSDLGIKEWLQGAIFTDVLLHSVGKAVGPGAQNPDVVSYEIKFVIVSSGNVTPTWKLAKVSANTAGNFFSTGRTRTHDLIITIGPKDSTSLQSNLALQIGNAVSNANRSLLTPP